MIVAVRRRRRRLGPRRTAVAIGLALLLAGCGQNTIRQHAAEQNVAHFVYTKTGFRPVDVRCPSGVTAKAGGTFDCHFTGPDARYVAHVRIISVSGQRVVQFITSRPVPGTAVRPSVNARAAEATVSNFVFAKTRFRPTDVSCPSAVSAQVGTRFDCHFTGPDGHYVAHVQIGEHSVDRIATRRIGP